MKSTLRFWHLPLLGLAPPLLLYSHNRDLVELSFLWRPLGLSLGLVAILFGLAYVVFRRLEKASLITSVWVVGFFSFGHIWNLVSPVVRDVKSMDLFYPFLGVWAIVILAITALLASSKRILKHISYYFTATGAFLLFLPLAALAWSSIQSPSVSPEAGQPTLALNPAGSKPDIYFIVVDGYARADVLKSIYQYDNSGFIQDLKEEGFTFIENATANYPQTFYSIAATLNFQYLDAEAQAAGQKSNDRGWLRRMISRSRVWEVLRQQGYRFATLPSSWVGLSRSLPADYKFAPPASVNDFENLVISTTPLRRLIEASLVVENHRKNVLYALEHLSDVAQLPEPTFSYTHIMAPHPPFIFQAEGQSLPLEGDLSALDGSHYFRVNPKHEEYLSKYRDQLSFMNTKIQAAVSAILENSAEPPVIILQSDHGPGSELDWESAERTNVPERFSILNAIFVPDQLKGSFKSFSSSVNIFRLLFNMLFGANYEILPDKNYFNTWDKPNIFIDVTERVQQGL